MEKKKIIELIKGKPWYVKLLILLLAGLIAYYSSGCAYKFHADRIDNVSHELILRN